MSSLANDPIYCPENIALFEAIYGKNLISLGGFAAVDNMFSDLNIRGLTALDLGFGLGGVVFYLAEAYQMEIAGVEIHSWMVKHAQMHAPPTVTHSLQFDVYNVQGEIPFAAKSFDLVYSKGVLNHVKDKDALFRQVNLVLKPKGLFVIADWIFTQSKTDNTGPLVKETRKSYLHALESTGFSDINFRDDSKIFLCYIKLLQKNLTNRREYIEQKYGKEIFSTLWKEHQNLIEEINYARKFAVRIVAKKQ